ncbi:MAG: polysaccharide deacetylase family protein [Smithellaceae bacterium]|nr:polysaccharide deacetylase family protein [Smithellaceae bacterium]
MGGKRERLADLLFKTRLIAILRRFAGHNKLVVLNYHRIRPDSATVVTPFDDGVFSANADQFFRQMTWLKRHTRILSEKELIDKILTNNYQKSNRPSVVITFDDGYHDNYSIAYPILKSLQIPAIFFISTEMIWERKLCWWDVLAYLIKQCRKPSIVIDNNEYTLQNNRLKMIEDFQLPMKEYPCGRIREELRLISEATEIDLPSDEIQDRELMTRDQIREMAAHQMTIGSHAHTHQALSCLDECEHDAELMVSKQLLEQTTGETVRSVSYPFGRYQYIPSSIQDAARKCGYQLGFTSNFGVNYLNQINNNMALKRFSGELEKVSTVSLITVWPELFASKEDGFLI